MSAAGANRRRIIQNRLGAGGQGGKGASVRGSNPYMRTIQSNVFSQRGNARNQNLNAILVQEGSDRPKSPSCQNPLEAVMTTYRTDRSNEIRQNFNPIDSAIFDSSQALPQESTVTLSKVGPILPRNLRANLAPNDATRGSSFPANAMVGGSLSSPGRGTDHLSKMSKKQQTF